MEPQRPAKQDTSQNGNVAVELHVRRILDQVKKEPTHLNYWNAYKRIQNLNLQYENVRKEKKVKIAFLGSFTMDLLAIYIDIECRLAGLYPEVYIAPFNQYMQEVLNGSSKLYSFDPDIVILAVQPESMLRADFSEFIGLPDKERYRSEILDELKSLMSTLSSKTQGLILVNNFIIPSFSPLGILDNKVDMGIKSFYCTLNQRLADLCRDSSQVYVVDLEGVAGKHGKSQCINYEIYYRGGFLFNKSFLLPLAREYMGYVKALRNLTKKCIVLDLDSILWGGILGEEGLEGIKLGGESAGNAYVDFQRILLAYHNRGIILAINSKNNYEDAIKVITEHPHMALREKHFAAMRINWQEKDRNMIELAEELNIGLDSIVFIDDNPREREKIRQALPEVLVIDMPTTPFLYRQALESINDFNILRLTEEDKVRGQMYYARKIRKQLAESSVSLENFLESLETKVEIRKADEFSLPRIVSLVNKTSQFNLTTRRYSDAQIRSMRDRKSEFNIYTLQVADKFGDEGIVGVAIVRKAQDEWAIDSFLMSCRVIGRKVETAFLARIVADAREEGVGMVIGEYIPTKKNVPVESFYSEHGFTQFQQVAELSRWKLDLSKATVDMPEWLIIVDEPPSR